MAAGDMPPYVVSGELITSAWGNMVVDRLKMVPVVGVSQSGTVSGPAGAAADVGVYNNAIAPFRYHLQFSAHLRGGQQAAGNFSYDVIRLNDGAGFISGVAIVPAPGVETAVPMTYGWDVQAGQNGGFKFRITPNTNMWLNSFAVWTMFPY